MFTIKNVELRVRLYGGVHECIVTIGTGPLSYNRTDIRLDDEQMARVMSAIKAEVVGSFASMDYEKPDPLEDVPPTPSPDPSPEAAVAY